ncbi:hypothetical protein VNI00_010937 [Paramarasmius palmivorus]|uniref:Serine-threonine/tyrosine-protein kinase catalytic domain-containing protein n=1 Tax=Paramarasmius palmivorus TaxID=297713 RepID=A0AAW0CDF9_9AGAR
MAVLRGERPLKPPDVNIPEWLWSLINHCWKAEPVSRLSADDLLQSLSSERNIPPAENWGDTIFAEVQKNVATGRRHQDVLAFLEAAVGMQFVPRSGTKISVKDSNSGNSDSPWPSATQLLQQMSLQERLPRSTSEGLVVPNASDLSQDDHLTVLNKPLSSPIIRLARGISDKLGLTTSDISSSPPPFSRPQPTIQSTGQNCGTEPLSTSPGNDQSNPTIVGKSSTVAPREEVCDVNSDHDAVANVSVHDLLRAASILNAVYNHELPDCRIDVGEAEDVITRLAMQWVLDHWTSERILWIHRGDNHERRMLWGDYPAATPKSSSQIALRIAQICVSPPGPRRLAASFCLSQSDRSTEHQENSKMGIRPTWSVFPRDWAKANKFSLTGQI